ncbi:putative secreted protein, SAP45-like [Candidatus Phytoplasma luffae]|uniref:Secreted protein, SAP45-like n=1 Tax=Loofah witches'-broom phytoplasma TaxID=35773 RepID=A0A975FIA7_LOWBP|nr:SVM family protein [Candidatus Phytoplasma luffae]QTX02925.1 putative secreted protein, SAP45-like [Candidatus Phytoplasma luffae]QTX02976.1 putative secreted protein, SAP45-like [Candidatus Phytoplasma luffae]
MIQVKNKLHLLPFFLMSCLGLFILITINPVMAMNDNNLNYQNSINNEINELLLKKQKISKKISHCNKLDLNTINLKQQLKILDQTILNLYQRLADINVLKYINEKIWHYSYERNQVAIKYLSKTYQNTTAEELNNKHQEIIQKIKKLSQKYCDLQYKLNEFYLN